MHTKASFILVLALLLSSVNISAQTRDTLIKIGSDTSKNAPKTQPKVGPVKSAERLELEAKPRRGAIQSAILPGYGNYKNKSFAWYVKVPAIYAGLIMFTDQFFWNKNQYKLFLRQATLKQDGSVEALAQMDPKYNRAGIELSDLITAKDLYRRNRDLCVLGGLAVYGINIVDAYISGKFLRYDITPELSLRVNPSFQGQSQVSNSRALPAPALKVSLSFK